MSVNRAGTRNRAKARNSDPATSHEAADSIRNLRDSQIRIWMTLLTKGPMSDEGLYHSLSLENYKISPSGCRTRRSELVAIGLVYDTGTYVLTETNRKSIVWAAKTEAQLRAEEASAPHQMSLI